MLEISGVSGEGGETKQAQPTRLLLVDDDASLRHRLRLFLTQNGLQVREAASGPEALRALEADPVDVILLDLVMPGMDGLEVMRRARAHSEVPILLLTAKDSETDQVVGLEMGADDYIVKPFRARELLARIRTVLRRTAGTARGPLLSAGDIEVDVHLRTVRRRGRDLALSGIEFDLLAAFLRTKGRVVPREALLAEAGRNHVTVSERTVDVHVSRLRKKLGEDPRAPRLIKTVHGVGYIFLA